MRPIVSLTTDFGLRDGFVGVLKGVILRRAPSATIVDIAHDIPPQQILPGALVLRSGAEYFPAHTVHLAIVDPGVGSARRAIAIRTAGGTFVGPDNGILLPAVRAVGPCEAREITNPRFVGPSRSNTFHGRDIFAPAAAALADGADFESIGPRLSTLETLAIPSPRLATSQIDGEVIHVDHFGNAITNVEAEHLTSFRPEDVSVTINGNHASRLRPSYAAAPAGALLAVINSWNMLELAVRNGSAARVLGIRVGTAVRVNAARSAQ